MRKLVFIIFVATFLFALNITFYILSEDYRFFIKKIKYSDTVVYDTGLTVDDTNTLPETEEDSTEVVIENSTDDTTFIKETGLTFFEPKRDKPQEEELELSGVEKDILKLFEEYDLKLLSKHASLFDLTTEYPDEYFEYYSNDVVLYFFSTKSYSEVFDIFEVLAYELPYDINEVNNFWQSSFYLNLKEVYTDDFIRLVVQYKNKAFWLKINKDTYNEVKQILEPLKSKK